MGVKHTIDKEYADELEFESYREQLLIEKYGVENE